MPLNVEARAQVDDAPEVIRQVAKVTGASPREVGQEDVFFNVQRGRLMLRREDDHAELIFYSKLERKEPRPSSYFRRPLSNAESTEQELASRFGVRSRIKKRRWVFEFNGGRIHVDDLGPLGSFIEIAVSAANEQMIPRAYAKVRRISNAVGIPDSRLVAEEYETLVRDQD